MADDGHIYFCKADKDGRRLRATEWVATSLARHLGLSVANFSVIEDDSGETYFGSRSPKSVVSDRFELDNYIRKASQNELGGAASWLGQFFAQLFAFDLFICNPDRDLRNFILDRDGQLAQLQAIDFASADLLSFPSGKYPIETDPTVRVGKLVRLQHGVHKAAAVEMLERISAIPRSAVEGIVEKMPRNWLSEDQTGGFLEVWSDGRSKNRANELKALIEHEW